MKLLPLHTAVESICDCRRDCPSPAKHPRINSWQVQATDDLITVQEWWSVWPVSNIGAVAGASGVVVLDVDPRHGGPEALQALVDQHGVLPPGPRSVTGSGGWHFYFQHPGKPLGNSASKVGPGLDVKADGGYVVVPPSVHVTGVSYRWDTDPADGMELSPANIDYPPLPLWLHLLMEQAAAKPAGGAVPVGEVIPQGERRDRLLSLGGTVRHRGASEGEIFAYLMAVNAERCAPPMDRGEVAKLAAQVAQFPIGEAILVVGPKTRGEREPQQIPVPFSAPELQAMVLEPPRWALPGILPEGLSLLAGRPKLGKSWWTFNVGIAVAEGGIALGEIPVDDGDVLVLALEDGRRRLQSRMEKMLGEGTPWPPRLYLVDMSMNWPRQDQGGLEALDAWLGSHPETRLVVIDTLARFKAPQQPGGKRGDIYAEDYAMGEELQKLAGRHNIAVLAVTHYNKGIHEDWLNSVTGSTGLTGVVDTVIALARPRGSKGQGEAVLHVTGRDVEENDWAIQFDGALGQWRITGDVEDASASREALEVIEALAKIIYPATIDEVAAMLDITRAAAKKRLYRAALNGLITNHGNGIYSLLSHRSTETAPAAAPPASTTRQTSAPAHEGQAAGSSPAHTPAGRPQLLPPEGDATATRHIGDSGQTTHPPKTDNPTNTDIIPDGEANRPRQAAITEPSQNDGVSEGGASPQPLSPSITERVISGTGTGGDSKGQGQRGTLAHGFNTSESDSPETEPPPNPQNVDGNAIPLSNSRDRSVLSRPVPQPQKGYVEPPVPPRLAGKACPECGVEAWRSTGTSWICGNCRPAITDIKTGKAVSPAPEPPGPAPEVDPVIDYPDWLQDKACQKCRVVGVWTKRADGGWRCSICHPHIVAIREEGG